METLLLSLFDGVPDNLYAKEVEEFLDLDAAYVRTSKVPWYNGDGDVRGLVGLTQDITERKVREHDLRRQHERMVKTAVVAAHEFRNELQIARGRLEEISSDQDHADCIDESLARTEAIVDMVVDLSSKETTVEDPKAIWLSRSAEKCGIRCPSARRRSTSRTTPESSPTRRWRVSSCNASFRTPSNTAV